MSSVLLPEFSFRFTVYFGFVQLISATFIINNLSVSCHSNGVL